MRPASAAWACYRGKPGLYIWHIKSKVCTNGHLFFTCNCFIHYVHFLPSEGKTHLVGLIRLIRSLFTDRRDLRLLRERAAEEVHDTLPDHKPHAPIETPSGSAMSGTAGRPYGNQGCGN